LATVALLAPVRAASGAPHNAPRTPDALERLTPFDTAATVASPLIAVGNPLLQVAWLTLIGGPAFGLTMGLFACDEGRHVLLDLDDDPPTYGECVGYATLAGLVIGAATAGVVVALGYHGLTGDGLTLARGAGGPTLTLELPSLAVNDAPHGVEVTVTLLAGSVLEPNTRVHRDQSTSTVAL
jgi:hypothetical protein